MVHRVLMSLTEDFFDLLTHIGGYLVRRSDEAFDFFKDVFAQSASPYFGLLIGVHSSFSSLSLFSSSDSSVSSMASSSLIPCARATRASRLKPLDLHCRTVSLLRPNASAASSVATCSTPFS